MNSDIIKSQKLAKAGNLDDAIETINKMENVATNELALLHRAELYKKKQQYAEALNDYQKVSRINPNQKKATTEIEMLKEILKYEAIDIYASTNLNNDPWLD